MRRAGNDSPSVQAKANIGKQTHVAARYGNVQRRVEPIGSAPVQMALVPTGGQLLHGGGSTYFEQTVERINNQAVESALDLTPEQAKLLQDAIRGGRLWRGNVPPEVWEQFVFMIDGRMRRPDAIQYLRDLSSEAELAAPAAPAALASFAVTAGEIVHEVAAPRMAVARGMRLAPLTLADVPVPVRVGTDSNWSAIAVGDNRVCSLRGGRLYCWGSNEDGQLGVGASRLVLSPTYVDLP